VLFALYCRDKPGATELRLANRPAHLEFARAMPCIRMAGPLLDDAGTTMVGSLFVIDVESLDAARAFSAGDPYTRAGLWQSVAIHPFRWLLPEAK
jgi:hypothetical protein